MEGFALLTCIGFRASALIRHLSHNFKIKDLIRKYFDGSLLNMKSKC